MLDLFRLFQYKDTRVECDVIFDNTFDVLEANSTIYIATGTSVAGNLFSCMSEHFCIRFLLLM